MFGLMAVAEEQQGAVQAALDGLAAERLALGREREGLAQERQALARSTREAVRGAVAESLAGAAGVAAETVREATRPLLGQLAGVADRAGEAEAALRRVVSWASWRLLGWVLTVAAMVLLVGWLAGVARSQWDERAIGLLQARKAVLEAEIAGLEGNRDALVRAGAWAKLERCGPKSRPCLRMDDKAGTFGPQADHRVILGY